jgi:hypothetical protein
MNDDFERPEGDRADAEEALATIRQAGRVDFALRIAQSLQAGSGAPRPLALAFEDTVTRVLPPESRGGEAQREAS